MKHSFIVVVIIVTAVTWFVMAIANGFPSTFWEATKPFIIAISVAGTLSYLYQHHMWHWWLLQHSLAKTPDLRGMWEVTIQPIWVDSNRGMQMDPVEGYAQIDQTASSLSMRLYSCDSRSQSIAFSIDEIHNEFRLAVIYENKPRMEDRPREGTSHQGAAIYRFRGFRPSEMTGEYWTETKNLGNIKLHNRIQQGGISSFEDGQQVFAST